MKKLLLITILLGLKLSAKAQTNQDSLFIRKIFDQALTDSRCYPILQHLCKNIGPRLSGSIGAADAVKFMQDVMQEEQFSKVFLQECMVPHWVRGSICKVQETNSKRNLKGMCARRK
jgi:carboxypeptidase Q